jgi:hypothetical protein
MRGRVVLGLLVVGLVALVNRPVANHFKWRHGGDCVRYITWSRVVAEKGLAAFPPLVQEYRNRWIGFPPPIRWSYLLMVAGVMRAWPSPSDDYHPLVFISFVFGVLAFVPVWWWLRLRAPPPATVLAALLVTTAPVTRGMSKYPVVDAIQLTLALSLFAAIAEWLRSPRRSLLYAIGGITLFVLSSREAAFVFLFAGTAMVVHERVQTGTLKWPPLWAMFAGCSAMLLISAALAGGFGQLFLLARDVVHGAMNTGNGAYVGGAYYRYLVDLMMVSPVVMVTAAVSAGWLRQKPDLKPITDQVLVATVVSLIFLSILPKTLRYVMVVDSGLRIICALTVWALYREGGRRRILGVVVFLALIAHDEALHALLFARDQVYDPVQWSIARQLRMIP